MSLRAEPFLLSCLPPGAGTSSLVHMDLSEHFPVSRVSYEPGNNFFQVTKSPIAPR